MGYESYITSRCINQIFRLIRGELQVLLKTTNRLQMFRTLKRRATSIRRRKIYFRDRHGRLEWRIVKM